MSDTMRDLSLADLMADLEPTDRARQEYARLRESLARVEQENVQLHGLLRDHEQYSSEQRAEIGRLRGATLAEAADIAQQHLCRKGYGLCDCQGDIAREIRQLAEGGQS